MEPITPPEELTSIYGQTLRRIKLIDVESIAFCAAKYELVRPNDTGEVLLGFYSTIADVAGETYNTSKPEESGKPHLRILALSQNIGQTTMTSFTYEDNVCHTCSKEDTVRMSNQLVLLDSNKVGYRKICYSCSTESNYARETFQGHPNIVPHLAVDNL